MTPKNEKNIKILFISSLLMLAGALLLRNDLRTAMEFFFLEGVEAPLIEPWFFTSAFEYLTLIFFGAIFIRRALHRKRLVVVFIVGWFLQLAANINAHEHYFFIPPHVVGYLIIISFWMLLALAVLDLCRALKELYFRKIKPNSQKRDS